MKSFSQYLAEADFTKNPAVSPEYLKSLSQRGDQMVKDITAKHGAQMGSLMRAVNEVRRIQNGKERELEKLATDIILDEYGSILGDTKLDIRIPEPKEMGKEMKDTKLKKPEPEEAPKLKIIGNETRINAIHKRKILNTIAQGEAINSKRMLAGPMAEDGLTKLFGEADAKLMISSLLLITDICNARDWNIPEEIAAKMMETDSALSGSSTIKWDKPKPIEKPEDWSPGDDVESEQDGGEPDQATLVILGLDLAMLFHEAVKAIRGLINQGGLAHLTEDDVRAVFMNTDTVRDEAQDLKRGALTAADLREFLNTFDEINKMQNGREYVWGKMIDATVIPDKEFLVLMKDIFNSAPIYNTEIKYSDSDTESAKPAMARAQQVITKLITLIQKELSDWEESNRENYQDSDYTEPADMDNRSPSNTEIDLDKPLTNSEIQDKIDLEFDKINRAASRGEAKDFTEVDRLTKLLK
jgi:hypothetical protein